MRKKFLVLLGALTIAAGCVSIDDPNVRVVRPGEIDPYRRNVLNVGPVHVYPHRLILAQAATGSILTRQGQSAAVNQADFDNYWGGITPILDPNSKTNSSLKPVVNFEREVALFVPMATANTCTHYGPYGDEMTTDGYNITIPIYWYQVGQNCQPSNEVPVFIYIYPRSEWPITVKMIGPTPTNTPIPPTPTLTPMPTATPTPEEEEE